MKTFFFAFVDHKQTENKSVLGMFEQMTEYELKVPTKNQVLSDDLQQISVEFQNIFKG